MKRPRNQQRDALGAREAQTLGNEFAEHHLQDREKAENDDQRDAVRDDRGPGPANLLDERADNRGQRDLAEIAQRKAGDA